MVSITRADAEKLLRSAQSARNYAKNIKERAEESLGQVVETVEIGSMSFAMGIINGRWNGVEVLGVPLDLGLSLGLHTVGFLLDGNRHLHALANGAGASYLVTMGAGVGREMAAQAAKGAPAQLPKAAAGFFPGGNISEAQLHELARSA